MNSRCALVVLVMSIVGAIPARGQEQDGHVVPPGRLRLTVGGQYLHLGGQFVGGGRESLGAEWGGPLTAATFAPLLPVVTRLESFFAATEPGPITIEPGEIVLGDLGVDVAWNTRTVPLRLSMGVLPRLEVGVRASVYRNERFTRRFDLLGGNLGRNPDPVGNAELLEAVDSTGRVVGLTAVLPLEGSLLGNELQSRVVAGTGERLALPEEPLHFGDMEEIFDVERFPYMLGEWLQGDVEIDARVEILRSFDEVYYPDPSGPLHYRLTALAAFRLPTGQRGAVDPPLDWGPEIGFGAQRVGAVGDVFLGERVWISGGGTLTRISEGEARVPLVVVGGFAPPNPAFLIVRRNPGNELDLWLQPRFRLTREMSLGAAIRREQWGEGTDAVAGVPTSIPSRSRTSLGGAFRYTTLAGFGEGRSRFALETALGLSVAISGSEGVPVSRLAFVQVSLLRRVWGSRTTTP